MQNSSAAIHVQLLYVEALSLSPHQSLSHVGRSLRSRNIVGTQLIVTNPQPPPNTAQNFSLVALHPWEAFHGS